MACHSSEQRRNPIDSGAVPDTGPDSVRNPACVLREVMMMIAADIILSGLVWS